MLTSMLVGYLFCFELKSFPKPWSLELDVLPARPTTKKAYTHSMTTFEPVLLGGYLIFLLITGSGCLNISD
jgi:hypothetical protein